MNVRFHVVRSLGGTQKTGPVGDVRDVTLAEFRGLLQHIPTANKYSVGSWCPVDFVHPPEVVASGYLPRSKEFVTGASDSVWLDLDKLAEKTWQAILDHVAASGWEAEAWTTHSYGDPKRAGLVSCRMRISVDREHTTGEEVEFAREGMSALLTKVAGLVEHVADKMCFRRNQVFYLPAVDPTRPDAKKVWIFDGLTRPRVSDLAALGQSVREASLESTRARLVAEGKLADRAADEPATDADRAFAEQRFAELSTSFTRAEELPGRLMSLFRLGSRVGSTAAVGGLDLDASTAAVEALLLANRPQDFDICWKHFSGGLARGTLPAWRGEDAVVEAIHLAEQAENKTWVGVREALASAPAEVGTLDDARAALDASVKAATVYRGGADRSIALVMAPPGVGKTTFAAKHAGIAAANGAYLAYLAPTHLVAQEFIAQLPEAARAVTVHAHSPLQEIPGVPTCTRPDKARLKLQVNQLGVKQHKICEVCPLAATCEAKTAWESRIRRAKGANLLVLSHKNVSAALGDPDRPRRLLIDEQPPPVDSLTLKPADLAAAKRAPVDTFFALIAALESGRPLPATLPELANAFAESLSPESEAIEAANVKVLAFARAAKTPGAVVTRLPNGDQRVASQSPIVAALREHGGAVFSATPATDVFDPAQARLDVVTTARHPAHRRVIFPLHRAGRNEKKGLVQSNVEAAGRWVGARAEELGGRGLLVTFLKDAAAPMPPNVDVAYYGNIQGRNDWMTHKAVICVGTPYDQHLQDAEVLQVEPWAYQRARAAAEVRQAVDRLRPASRGDEALVLAVLGAVAPAGWSEAELASWDADTEVDGRAAVVAAVAACGSVAEVARRLEVSHEAVRQWRTGARPVPTGRLADLRELCHRNDPSGPLKKKRE